MFGGFIPIRSYSALVASLGWVMNTHFAVEYLILVLIAASLIAVLAARLRIPYTVALVLGGLVLGSFHLPLWNDFLAHRPDWLTPDVTLVIFLPALLFEGSLKMQVRHLRENLTPILLLASAGVLVATLFTGFAVYWAIGMPLLVALVFGSIVAATDPISVLAIFKGMAVAKRLAVIVEGESLFNDGTAAVLFSILAAGAVTGRLSVGSGIHDFLVVVLGGAAVGLALGYLISKVTARIDEPSIEITLTTILAYGSYLAAESLHVSGVIAVVMAGLMVGNFGMRVGMSAQTRVALWSFWEYASFVINSIVFLLIGLQVRLGDLLSARNAVLIAVAAVVLGRMLSVYGLTPVSNAVTERIPSRWQHVLVLGGMRGSLSLALVMSLGLAFPFRNQLLAMTFGVVAFTIIVQGLAMKPALRLLGVSIGRESDYSRARAQQIALSASRAELDRMLGSHLLSLPAYEQLRGELDSRIEKVKREIADLFKKDEIRAGEELQGARRRLVAAEKSSIEQALHEGIISEATAVQMLDNADKELDKFREKSEEDVAPHEESGKGGEA
jgi:Na+:H+ antiporter